MTQARWPSSCVAARSVSAWSAATVAGHVDDRQRSVGPSEGLLDVRLGVAHELAEEREGVSGDLWLTTAATSTAVMVAIVEPTSRRSQRDGE